MVEKMEMSAASGMAIQPEEVRTIVTNGLFRYGRKVLGAPSEELFLEGIDLADSFVYCVQDKTKIEPLQLAHLRDYPDYFISNTLACRIFENAARVLPGEDPLFHGGRAFITDLPSIRRTLAWIKLVKPSYLIERIARENWKYTHASELKVQWQSSTCCRFSVSYYEGVSKTEDGSIISKTICDWNRGIYQSYGELLGAEEAECREIQCVQDGHPNCIFELSWSRIPFNSRLRNFIVHLLAREEVLEMEEAVHERDRVLFKLRQLVDERTAELREANAKLKIEYEHSLELQEQLEQLAVTDELTSLYNRRYFKQWAEIELQRVQRYHRELSMILFDIDHFKLVNDTFGHAGGDTALKALADLFKHQLRRLDFFARIGGEEFAIVLPETGLTEAMEVTRRLRKVLRENPSNYAGQEMLFTISCGLVSLRPAEAVDLELFLARADQAMYAAKDSGRDRIVVWNEEFTHHESA